MLPTRRLALEHQSAAATAQQRSQNLQRAEARVEMKATANLGKDVHDYRIANEGSNQVLIQSDSERISESSTEPRPSFEEYLNGLHRKHEACTTKQKETPTEHPPPRNLNVQIPQTNRREEPQLKRFRSAMNSPKPLQSTSPLLAVNPDEAQCGKIAFKRRHSVTRFSFTDLTANAAEQDRPRKLQKIDFTNYTA